MFRRKQRPPDTPFVHADDCRILAADPGVEIPWSEIERGHWRRECVCTFEGWSAPLVDDRARLDPYDAKTSRHLPQCEYVSETNPAVLKILLKVKPGLGPGYDWVECGGCGAGWQVPHYAESVG